MEKITGYDALVVVDLQRDFCPGGALPVPEGDKIVPVVNDLVRRFLAVDGTIVFSRDSHPEDHCSFSAQGGSWPPHCVAGTPGAAFHRDLHVPDSAIIVSKATTAGKDAYSALEGTGLARLLHDRGVRRLFVTGLATDYCVRATVLEALDERFEVWLVVDAVRGVEVSPGDVDAAVREMADKGAMLIEARQIEV